MMIFQEKKQRYPKFPSARRADKNLDTSNFQGIWIGLRKFARNILIFNYFINFLIRFSM